TTALSPRFILRTLDRVGFYEVVRAAAVDAFAPSPELLGATGAKAMRTAIENAMPAALLREQAQVVVPKALDLVKNPPGKPQLTLDLAKFRQNLSTSIDQEAKKIGAPSWQVAVVKAKVDAQIPKQIDLLRETGLTRANLVEVTKYYRYLNQALLASSGLAIVLGLLIFLLAGRRYWGSWLGVTALTAGGISAAAAIVAGRSAAPFLTEMQKTASPMAGVSAKTLAGMIEGTAAAVQHQLLLIGLVGALVGIGLWVLGAMTARRAAPTPPVAPPAGAGPTTPV
ncbi:MAG: hypothetical protein ACYC6V_04725, partial [Bacillota bacterium]